MKDFLVKLIKNPYVLNLLLAVVVACALVFGTLKWLDSYTRHNEAVVVPDVKGLGMEEAAEFFKNSNLRYNVIDSVFSKDVRPGAIVELVPMAGSKVKEGRIIYLTINAINIPLQVVPDVADNSSLRQAEARILASGFKLNDIQYVPGEKDWVYGVKYRERMLAIGDKVPMGATLTLMVGDGNREVLEGDSLFADESMGNPDEAVSEGSAADESWF